MLLPIILCVNSVLVSADNAEHNGHCAINDPFCKEEDKLHFFDEKLEKLLFYDVNPPEGFNLRRDVYMRFAIMLSEARKRGQNTDWVLVLPSWHALYHWKSESHHEPPKPWSMFFDVPSLFSYVPVLELYNLQTDRNANIQIDSLYILQNFDDPFENGEFRDKWNIAGPCKYEGHFGGYRNISAERVICIHFQGTITQLWEIINLRPNDEKVMFIHGEIPLHSSYGTKTYWDCRKSMKFNTELVEVANLYITQKLKCSKIHCSNYLAIHWRRQDFLHTNRSPSIKGTVNQIQQTIVNKSLTIRDIFIASDGTDKELKALQLQLQKLGYKTHTYIPNVTKYLAGQIAIIDQIICSRSAYFIGTHESTFTYRIQEEREILGFNSDTTFNSLCPDVGTCEKPSRWTIIH